MLRSVLPWEQCKSCSLDSTGFKAYLQNFAAKLFLLPNAVVLRKYQSHTESSWWRLHWNTLVAYSKRGGFVECAHHLA